MMVSPFTPAQLDLLIEINDIDDWRPDALATVLHEQRPAAVTVISDEDFTDLIGQLEACPPEVIGDLQTALSILGNFPQRIYYAGNTNLLP